MDDKTHGMPPEGDEMMTELQVLERYPFSRQTLWRMRDKGLPHWRANSRIVYSKQALEAFMARGNKELSQV